MRGLIWIFGLGVLLFCGWWGLASLSAGNGVQTWLDARRADGWQADTSRVSSSGFPREIRTVIDDLALADPGTGLALEADQLTLSARTVWPGDVHVALPQTPLRIATPRGQGTLQLDTGRADLNLAPGTDLTLSNLSFTSGPFRAEGPGGGLFSGSASELRMVQTDIAAQYDMRLTLDQFAPGAVPRAALSVPSDWPLVFSALQLRATVLFDRPWDRRAVEQSRPQPRRVDLNDLDLHWGDVRLRVTGAFDVDPDGVPDGQIVIKAENWQSMLDLAQNTGALRANLRQTVENVLSRLAAASGKTRDLDVTLTMRGGLVRMGFLPLGPASRFIIR